MFFYVSIYKKINNTFPKNIFPKTSVTLDYTIRISDNIILSNQSLKTIETNNKNIMLDVFVNS